jgi:HD-GYP domain-containing protein (c-di-GMP phosphodiesterase class II)
MPMLLRHCECLALVLAKRDDYTDAHCGRVEYLCLQLGVRCRLRAKELRLLRVAARLHDIGKIGIPDQILLKPGSLAPGEFEVMKTHATLGQEICERIPYREAAMISLFVRHHHEAFDGSGYPDRLSGEGIPLCSRIMSLADSYDAMRTVRPYQHARSHDQVMAIMREERGRKSDPVLFDQFEALIELDAQEH